ncbi:MAG TPA: DUF1801 domain-containing protein [Gemmatimonadaceae bacterium]|jgi:uncharacterized protein YdhG (YjbR/CyaY superfamily)
MAARKSPAKATKKAATRTTRRSSAESFTAEERAAMRERAKELKAASRPRAKGETEESDVLAKLATMKGNDRTLGERLHAIIRERAPQLEPRLWYGMPAYAKDGKVVCFFQDAAKFKARYATLGFSDKAMLDDGEMWPTSFALKALTKTEEARIVQLLKKAVG